MWRSPVAHTSEATPVAWRFKSFTSMPKDIVVYILFSSKTAKYYTGKTIHFERRLAQHNAGQNTSTKSGSPWICVWKSDLLEDSEASMLETKIKKRGAVRFLADIAEKQ